MVIWAVDASGKMPAREFFSKLSDSDAAKIQALFNRLAEFGQISNEEKFKNIGKLQGQVLWEFKSFQLRFLGGFAPGRQFLVAHGLRKKKKGHKPQELSRAARILNEHRHARRGEALDEGPYALRTS